MALHKIVQRLLKFYMKFLSLISLPVVLADYSDPQTGRQLEVFDSIQGLPVPARGL